jgi:hypothetical protein
LHLGAACGQFDCNADTLGSVQLNIANEWLAFEVEIKSWAKIALHEEAKVRLSTAWL